MEKQVSKLDGFVHDTNWSITRYASEEDCKAGKIYSEEEAVTLFGVPQTTPIEGNILVKAGINAAWTLICGGTADEFDNTNSYIGVGDSSTAEDADQTDLQAATNKLRVAMDSGYPTYGTNQQATWRSTFGSSDANWSWQEFAVFNASSGGTMLNRKISDQGTKTSGQTWQVSLVITLS